MSLAPVQPRPTYEQLSTAQKAAARAIANLPTQMRLQANLDGAVRNMEAKLDFAMSNGIEPPGALRAMIADTRTKAELTRVKLLAIRDQVRDAVREGVYRGWFTYQQAVDSGIFRAPVNSGLGEPVTILVIAVAAVIVLGGGYYVIQTKLDEHNAAALAAQQQAAASATQLQAWWTASGFTGSPATVNPDGTITPPNASAPTPGILPGSTPTPGGINTNPAGAGLPSQGDSLSKQLGGVVKWGIVAIAAAYALPALLKGFRQ